MPTLLQRLKLRHKLAALSVVGVAMCVLPMVQVLRYQSAEIDRLRSAEAWLDPAVLAVALQRGLLAHGDAAAQVLRGHETSEGPRRGRQAEVDARLAVLDHTLSQQGPMRAADEAKSLQDDWMQLVQRVVSRSLGADDSDAAHRLLVEQTLQVIDLVADASRLMQTEPALASLAPLVRAAADELPRLNVALLRLHTADTAAALASAARGPEREAFMLRLATVETAIEHSLRPLREGRGSASADETPLQDAATAARAANLHHVHQLRDPAGSARDRATTLQHALQANFVVAELAAARVHAQVHERVGGIEQQRVQLIAGLALLALAATVLSVSVWKSSADAKPRPPTGEGGPPPPAPDGQWRPREATGRLLSHMRGPATADPPPATQPRPSEHDRKVHEGPDGGEPA